MRVIFWFVFVYLLGAFSFMIFIEYHALHIVDKNNWWTKKLEYDYKVIFDSPKSVRLFIYLIWPYFVVWAMIYTIKALYKRFKENKHV